MSTLAELIRKEELRHETGLLGEALEAHFQQEKMRETKPLYVHSVSKQERFYRKLYELTFENDDNAPDFLAWLGDDCHEFVYGTPVPKRSTISFTSQQV